MLSGRPPHAFFSRSALFPFRLPAGGVGQLFRIEKGEAGLLAWVTLIQAMMSLSSIMVNNVAQTTFLKRFGTDTLPMVFMVEAVTTLGLTALIGLLMARFTKIRVFSGLLLFYGAAMAIIRGLIPTGTEWIYPVLYILKSQAVGVLPILYWDILSDLFTTRQSKRLYTLISAGGILGIMTGSLMTRPLAIRIGIDNILVVFTLGMIITACLNEMTEKIIKRPIDPGRPASKKQSQGLGDMGRSFISQWQASPLLRYMVLLIAIPNMILPILDFQFNVMVDEHFASEAGTLGFFGMFRGISNGMMFAGLMVSSRLIARWGIPTCLLFHPFNYLAAFLAVLLRFDIIVAVYARFSTEMLKTVLNNPARAVLYNFFPEKHRSMIRLILRGGVVRISDFAGSGLLIFLTGIIEPRMLSLMAIPLAGLWVLTSLRLKQTYPGLLLALLKSGRLDWEQIQEDQQALLAKDTASATALTRGLIDPDPDTAVFSAQIISRSMSDRLPELILPLMPGQPLKVQKHWLALITPDMAAVRIPLIQAAVRKSPAELIPDWLALLCRAAPERAWDLSAPYLDHPFLIVRLQALMGMMAKESHAPEAQLCRLLDSWFPDIGLLEAGKTDRPCLAASMAKIYDRVQTTEIRAMALKGMVMAGHDTLEKIVFDAASDPNPGIRSAALDVVAASPGKAGQVSFFLKDPSPVIRARAFETLKQIGTSAIPHLLTAVSGPSRLAQDQATRLLRHMGIPQAAISEFVREKIQAAHFWLSTARGVSENAYDTAAQLLGLCLTDRSNNALETALRLIGALIFKDEERPILRAVHSRNRTDMDLVIEMLETGLHPRLAAALIPLLEDRPVPERLDRCARALSISSLGAGTAPAIVRNLLVMETDPWIKALCLYAGARLWPARETADAAARFEKDTDPCVTRAAEWVKLVNAGPGGSYAPGPPDLVIKTAYLSDHGFFKPLKISDIMPLARACRFIGLNQGEVLVEKGSRPDRVYAHGQGDLACTGLNLGNAMAPVIQNILDTGLAGEMAWMDGLDLPYGFEAASPCQVLEIPGLVFSNLLSAHPELVLTLCRNYTKRLRLYQATTRRECP